METFKKDLEELLLKHDIAGKLNEPLEDIVHYIMSYLEDTEIFEDSMDGDHQSALASAGWGTDEDYGSPYDDDGII